MKLRKIIGFMQFVFMFILCISFIRINTNALSSVGFGDVSYTETRTIFDGVTLEYAIGYNNNEDQKAYTVEMEKGSLIPYATYGDAIYGGERLTSMIERGELEMGKKVVVAINGDFYDTSNGIPLGTMICNGKVVTLGANAGTETVVGFKNDGTVVFGNTSFELSFNDGTNKVNVKYLNNDRKYNTKDLFLYTSAFGTSTKSYASGLEIVLEVSDDKLFTLDQEVKAKVVSRGEMNESIGAKQIVIASGDLNDSRLAGLTVGKEITIVLKDNNPSVGWSDVVQSIGYPHLLATNGKPTATAINDPAVHPRTALGVKEDGTVVLLQVDGRQPGWSNGVTFKQMVEWMCDIKGCETVINLDGGGSSTIIARLPGDEDGTILNSPSDGVERSNANGILFFAPVSADSEKKVAHIHSYPNNLVILENAQTQIEVKASDKNYFPVSTPDNLKYSVSEGLGTITNGKFIASNGAKTGKITISSGDIITECNVQIVDSISKITADKTIISISPSESIEIGLTVYSSGMPIICSNSSFNWRLSSSTIGTIKDGVFTGSSAGGTGSIAISYKTFELQIPVEVGKQPVMLSTFEDVTIGGNWVQTIESPGGGGKGSVSINNDERYVKFGRKSLRIDYDFRSATATTSVTAYTPSYIKLEGYPTNIGMWVYGDGNGANVRIQIRDGNNKVQYISFNPSVVDWLGWKYIEADIPSGLPTPIQIQYGIRVMSVGGKVKTSGTLYFDNFRAVYGFRNDDTLEPQFKNITPADGSNVTSNQQHISLTVWDEEDINNIKTGINKNSIEFLLNEVKLTNIVLQDNSDGSLTINYTPSALSLLKAGPQIVKIRVEDNYGNITIKQWQFLLEGEYIGVDGNYNDVETLFAGATIDYDIKALTYDKFNKVSGTIIYDNKTVNISSITLVDKNLVLSTDNISSANGKGECKFTITNMDKSSITTDKVMARVTFSTANNFTGGKKVEVSFKDVYVFETGSTIGTKFLLPSIETIADYRYRVSYVTSTVGYPMTFYVTNESLIPVKDVVVTLKGSNFTYTGVTDENGYTTIQDTKTLESGTSFTLSCASGDNYSQNNNVTMRDSLASSTPSQIVVSPGVDSSNSVFITWQTNLATTNTDVKYRKVGDTDWITDVKASYTKQIYVVNGNVTQEYLSHIVEINNLSFDTQYEYLVGDGVTYSSSNKFKTTKQDNIDILFFGDPQNTSTSGYELTKKVMQAGLLTQPSTSLVMYAGDVVDNVTIYNQWQAFDTVLGEYNSSIITAAATGNHDVITGYAAPFKYSLAPSTNGCATIGANYYFEAGNSIIAVIDTETYDMFDEEASWLIDLMLKSDKKYRIVLMHRSPYAANYDEPYIRDYWPGVFEKARIDLVLSGHDHVYTSTTMLNGKKTSTDKGVTYVVGGSCGQKFYAANNLETRYWLDYLYDDDYNIYSTISINNEKLTLTSYALVNGVSEQINKIIIGSQEYNCIDTKVDIESLRISPMFDHQLTGVITDLEEVQVSELKWSLKDNITGVSVSSYGLIVLTNGIDYSTTKEITIIGEYLDKKVEITIKINELVSQDILENEYQKIQGMLNNMFD